MVTLSLLRHAKSSWGDLGLPDFDRPLASRGLAAAPAMGRYMREQGLSPGLVLSSPARRARQTLDLVRPFLDPAHVVRIDDSLYPSSPDEMLETLAAAAGGHGHVLMVGHNPGMHALAVSLAGSGDESLRADLAGKFPTGGLAVLEFEGGWDDIGPGKGRLVHFMVPRRLFLSAR